MKLAISKTMPNISEFDLIIFERILFKFSQNTWSSTVNWPSILCEIWWNSKQFLIPTNSRTKPRNSVCFSQMLLCKYLATPNFLIALLILFFIHSRGIYLFPDTILQMAHVVMGLKTMLVVPEKIRMLLNNSFDVAIGYHAIIEQNNATRHANKPHLEKCFRWVWNIEIFDRFELKMSKMSHMRLFSYYFRHQYEVASKLSLIYATINNSPNNNHDLVESYKLLIETLETVTKGPYL